MAAGLLALATYTELVEDKKTGLRYQFGDIRKLADNIRFVYENKDRADMIAANGAQEIRQRYSIERNAAEVYALYRNVKKGMRPRNEK